MNHFFQLDLERKINLKQKISGFRDFLVGDKGIEPLTFFTSKRRSTIELIAHKCPGEDLNLQALAGATTSR